MTLQEFENPLDKLREKVKREAFKVFSERPSFYSCYVCKKQFVIGDTFTWHVTGFTYCLHHMPSEKILTIEGELVDDR